MNNNIKKAVNFLIFFGLALVLLYFAFRKVDIAHLVKGFKEANYFWVSLSIIIALLAGYVRAIRWRLLMEPLGPMPPKMNVYAAVMIGYLANFAFPRIGEITKCATLRKTDNVPFESLIGTVIIERASDMAMLLFFVIATFLIRIDFFGHFLLTKIFKPLFTNTNGFSFTSIIILLSFFIVIYLILHLIRKNVFGKKVKSKVKSMYYGIIDGLKSITRMRRKWQFIFYSFVLWGLYILMTFILLQATRPTCHLGLIDSLFVMVVGSFGMVVPVQGGFGAFHIITAMGLGLFGISWEDGLVFATIGHESQTIMFIIAGLLSMVYLFFKNKTRIKEFPKT